MIIAGAGHLEQHKQIVDELNVFPVPDGDTGTNMSLTILAAAKEVEKTDSLNVYEVSKAAANGSLRGARGNSGVIVSQLFRGFSKALEGHHTADTTIIANAFRRGVETAYKAVMKPKEGTILTVAREGAEKALQLAVETDDCEKLLRDTLIYANEILQKTPEMLPVLKQAGVVDSGGQGLLYFMQGAFDSLFTTQKIQLTQPVSKPVRADFSALATIDHEEIVFGYCTEFFINAAHVSEQTIEQFKGFLEILGDSIVVVNDEEIIKVHIHTDHPGQVLEKAMNIGSLSNMKIDNMREEHAERVRMEELKPIIKEKKPFGFVSVAIGDGLTEIFKGLGVDHVIQGGQTMNPSTEDILTAIDHIHADNIFILPNNKNIILAAKQASKLCGEKHIYVVPTETIPQGIGAMIGFEPNRSIEENLASMEENLRAVKTGQITYAVRDTSIDHREITQGNILGIIEGKIEVVSPDLETGTRELLDLIIDEDSEIVSIYYGQDVNEEDAEGISSYITHKYPDCEVEIHMGGQPLYYYIFSVE